MLLAPGGEALLTVVDNRLRLWERAEGEPGNAWTSRRMEERTDGRAAALSPDGSFLAFVEHPDGHTITVYDRRSRRSRSSPRHPGGISGLAFSPDSRRLAIAGFGDVAILSVDPEQPELALDDLRVGRGHERKVLSVTFSPDGKCLASGSDDGIIRLWDGSVAGADGRLIPRGVLRRHAGRIHSLVFSRDGRSLFSAGRGIANRSEVFRWRGASDEEVLRALGEPR